MAFRSLDSVLRVDGVVFLMFFDVFFGICQ